MPANPNPDSCIEKAHEGGGGTVPETLLTEIPGRDPIELVAWCETLESYYPTCEQGLKGWCCRTVEPDWNIFDCGAHIGYYSILFSQLAPDGRVWAFEPDHENGKKLVYNLAHNEAWNVAVVPQALSDTPGERSDIIHAVWGEDAKPTSYVFTTIDEQVADKGLGRLDLIKIDVDSFEMEVLGGARETIERFNPFIAIEVNGAAELRGNTRQDVLRLLVDMGYTQAEVYDSENFILKRGHTFDRPIDIVMLSESVNYYLI